MRAFVRTDVDASLDCFVRDISDTGARLRFKNPPSIGSRVELNIPSKGQVLASKVAWVANYEVGIAFDIPFSTAAVVEPPPATDRELTRRVAQLEAEVAALRQMLKLFQNYVEDKSDVA